MKKISKQRHLEMLIQDVPIHPNPKVDLEQYSTSAIIAADLLWNAYSLGDISSKTIMDFGCGTGIFSIASSLLGANKIYGIDIDEESIEIASETAKRKNIENIEFIHSDISEVPNDFKVDTLFQNPPFGSQKKAISGSDTKFINKAVAISDVVYSFHMASTHDYIYDYFEKLGGKISHEFKYNFPIPKIYDFHTKEIKEVKVIVFRVEIS
ncbi:METTL5 family protein [Methanobrevibacter sp. DSM 116169]|uniref:METTL5 family protein n=1 Tax=Methanobrevibacter sp. DSM 116169 TaxID=3242727 RepID=UPI0038FD0BFA